MPDDLGDFDYFIHAASIASPTFYRQHPIATMDANVTGLRLLLERSGQQQERGAGRRPASCSSRAARSMATPSQRPFRPRRPIPGRVSSTGPRACYDESKRYGETLCVNFAQQYGLPVTIVRPFNNYGPGLKITDRRVIPDLARDLLAGVDLVLHSDGSPTRTFCYVADAIVGYYKVLLRGRPGEAYNIGCESPEITIDELGERIAATWPRAVRLPRPGGARRASTDAAVSDRQPATTVPRHQQGARELGFAPDIALDEGLRRTLALVRREPRRTGGLMNVSIVGAGYVGLVTGLCLADRGHRVSCVDIDADEDRAAAQRASCRFMSRAWTSCSNAISARASFRRPISTTAVRESELTMIAVGTPLEDGAISLRYVEAAAAAIGRALAKKRDYHVVVVKSTVVPGTTDDCVRPILEETSGKQSGARLRPGNESGVPAGGRSGRRLSRSRTASSSGRSTRGRMKRWPALRRFRRRHRRFARTHAPPR